MAERKSLEEIFGTEQPATKPRKSLEEIFGSKQPAAVPVSKEAPRKSLDEIFGTPSKPVIEAREKKGGGIFSRLAKTGLEFAAGVTKGLGTTIVGAAELGERALEATAGRAVEAITGKRVGEQVTGLGEELRTGVLKPVGAAQKVGFAVEQIGEFFVPTGAAAGVTKGVTRLFPKAIEEAPTIGRAISKIIPRALGEAVEVTAKTAAQKAELGPTAITAGVVTAALPGVGALIARSPIGKALSATGRKLAPKMINTIIKPLEKEFRFGKNPGQAVAREGIVANSFDDLATKVSSKKKDVGTQIGEAVKKYDDKILDVSDILVPIRKAKEGAVAAGPEGQALLTRLNNLEDALTGTFKEVEGKITKVGERNLAALTPSEIAKLKTEIGDMTTWTNQAFDNEINQARAKIYGSLKDKLNDEIPELRSLNERYADLIGADNSIRRIKSIKERQNLLGFTDNVGIGAALGSVAMGNFGTAGSIIAGTITRRALGTVRARTEMARLLNGLTDFEKRELIKASPKFAAALRALDLTIGEGPQQ